MTISCQILIHKPMTGTHRPGQPVRGVIKYTIVQATEINEIILSLTGKGECSWTETQRRGNKTISTHYYGTEEYMSCYLSIQEKKDGDNVILPTGTYEREFAFILPNNIPSSFKDSTCNITYRLKLKFVRPGLFKSNMRFFAVIPVHSNLETNENDCPVVFGLKKTLFKPLSRENLEIDLRAEIDKTLISPEDETKLSFVVKNNTNVEIKSIKTEIICTMTYTANCGKRKVYSSSVQECVVESPRVPAEAIANLSNILKTLPEMYSIQNSGIINREYKLKVTVRLPIPYLNASVEMPILIGIRQFEETTEAGDEPPSYWEVMYEEEKGKNE